MSDSLHLKCVKESRSALIYPPGMSLGNLTGSWRDMKPVLDKEKCNKCGLCWIYCPDMTISRQNDYEIDYQYCKGCGICAEECPTEAISMVREDSD